MSLRKTLAVAVGASLGVLVIVLLWPVVNGTPTVLKGAVVAQDPNPAKQLPVGDVAITVRAGATNAAGKSDTSGFFSIPANREIHPGELVALRFRHQDYQPLDLSVSFNGQLIIARLAPVARPAEMPAPSTDVKIENVVASYSINSITAANVGSAVKTFEVVNKADVPCDGKRPCSPDGKWKAAIGSATLDAGTGNEFHNARASCIAGPCPFTRIEENNFSRDSQIIRVSALNWSDTATFLLEAEVYHPTVTSLIRQSYPVIFERALTFTLPAAAEGVSIEAQLNGSMIVFPLGPALFLSWANCQMLVNKDGTRVYRCELKPGYRFS